MGRRRLEWGDINYYRSQTLSYQLGPMVRRFNKETGKYENVGRVRKGESPAEINERPEVNGESELDEFSIMLLDYEPEEEEEEEGEEEEEQGNEEED